MAKGWRTIIVFSIVVLLAPVFPLDLTTASASTITVGYASSNGRAAAGFNYATASVLGSRTNSALTIRDYVLAPHCRYSDANYAVGEGDGTATITVNLTNPGDSPATCQYILSGGTATPGSDYIGYSGQLTFYPGQTTQIFQVTILDDHIVEPDETIHLSFYPPLICIPEIPCYSTLTIIDNDNNDDYYLYLPFVVR